MKIIITIYLLFFLNGVFAAEEESAPSALFDLSGQLPEIDPEVERREIKLPQLESLDLEVGGYAGALSIEDFGANYSYGLDLTFHATEDFFLHAHYGLSKVTDKTYRELNLPLFGNDRWRDVSSTGVALGWNVLHGEMFWWDSLVLSSSAYVLLGGGVLNIDNDDYFQAMAGAGVKFIPKDWLSIKAEARFSEYESNLLGYKKYSHNMELLLGFGVNFW